MASAGTAEIRVPLTGHLSQPITDLYKDFGLFPSRPVVPLFSLIRKTCFRLRSSRIQINQLDSELKMIEEFLIELDVENRGRDRPPSWICSIRKAAFEAEDLIDMYHLEKEYRMGVPGIMHKLTSVWERAFHIAPLIDVMKVRIHAITDFIAANTTTVSEHVRSNESVQIQMKMMMPLGECTPCGQEKFVVGLEADTQKLVSELIGHADTQLCSVSIVGMGGIGKTTLAGKVYTDPLIIKHFDCRLWIPVSRQFNYKELLIAILLVKLPRGERMSAPLGNSQEQELEMMVKELLQGKRYLAVLDNVSTQEDWDVLKSAFPDTGKTSRLIVTTRNSELQTGFPGTNHQMKTLTLQESGELFSNKAPITEDDTELLDIRERLLHKCSGLPLAIVVIADELKRKRRRDQWERVYHEITSLQGPLAQDIYKILVPSYDELSLELKSCFLRVSFFPADQEISTRKLMHVWEAHGLLSNHDDQVNPAETYLRSLINRNMIQAAAVSLDGRVVKRCKIHPLMHIISASKAKEEIFFQTQPLSEIRHRAIYSSPSSSDCFVKSPHLHSLLSFQPDGNINTSVKQLSFICLYSKLLKVLYLEGMNIRRLPHAIGFLRDLRYLNLRRTSIRILPHSMKFLLRLSTLDVRENPGLKGISIVKTLHKLQNLYIDASLEPMPVESSSHLCTLGWVNSQQIDRNDITKMKLQVLKIIITDLSRSDKLFTALATSVHLVCLKLHIKDYHPVLKRLPCKIFSKMLNLRTFHLRGWMNESEVHITGKFHVPVDELESLPHLSILRLQSIYTAEDELLISGGGFPQLVYLELSNVRNLKSLKVKRGQSGDVMPNLKELRITACHDMMLQSETLKYFRARRVLQTD